jgi:hypothetical protein
MRRSIFWVLALTILGLIAVPATASVPAGLEVRFLQGSWSCAGIGLEVEDVTIVAPGHRVAWIGTNGDMYMATHLEYTYTVDGTEESWSYHYGNGPKGVAVSCSTSFEDGDGLLTISALAVKVPRS